jgi:hypothetical protein
MTSDNDIGYGKVTAGFEYPKGFLQHAVLIARKVDDAVRDNRIH